MPSTQVQVLILILLDHKGFQQIPQQQTQAIVIQYMVQQTPLFLRTLICVGVSSMVFNTKIHFYISGMYLIIPPPISRR